MAVAARSPLVVVTPRLVPDCCVERCDYRPSVVRRVLRLMDELAQSGYEPSEALMAAIAREADPKATSGIPSSEPMGRGTHSRGPSDPEGAQIVADIWRALRAGKRDPMSIANYLCPRALDEMLEDVAESTL